MGRRARKDDGFNTPFKDLEIPAPPRPDGPARPAVEPRPDAEPRPDGGVTDDELFRRAMAGVTSLRQDDAGRIEPAKTLARQTPDDEALALMELESFVRGETPFELSDTEEFQSGVAPGVTHELLRSLKNGEFSFRRHCDLHGHTREEAHAALIDFIATARRDGERCVLVITGRGKSSPDGLSVLKETLPRWLARAPIRAHVLAFCTALGVHGGPGAFYVLLRRQGQRPFGVQA